jgi:hypothetical protein
MTGEEPTGDGYRHAHRVFRAEAAGSSPKLAVPACPRWSVLDLVAHQVHQLSGALDGSFPLSEAMTALTDADPLRRRAAAVLQQDWIDRGVQDLRAHGLLPLLDRWAALTEEAPGVVLDALVPDVVVHLFDLLGARGSRAHREHPVVHDALRFWAAQMDARLATAGQGGLRVEADAIAVYGRGTGTKLVGSSFELLRTLTGRRTRHQAWSALEHDASADAFELVAAYGWRDIPLDE